MSFDSEFNYSSAKSFLQTEITNCDNEPVGLTRIQNIHKNCALEKEIETLEGLSTNDKNLLLNFYNTYVTESKQDWMGRMLFNSENLINEITNFNTNPPANPSAAAVTLYESNSVHSDVSHIHSYLG